MSNLRLCVFAILSVISINSFADLKSDLKEVVIANSVAFQKMDAKAFNSTTTKNAIIIDEFFPFVWKGKRSSIQYIEDAKKVFEHLKVKDLSIVFNDAVAVEYDKTSAYAVFPVDVSYIGGDMKNHTEEGFQTVTFKQSKNGKWMIELSIWSTVKSEVK